MVSHYPTNKKNHFTFLFNKNSIYTEHGPKPMHSKSRLFQNKRVLFVKQYWTVNSNIALP